MTGDLTAYRQWTPAAQEKALDALRQQLGTSVWKPFYCPEPGCDGHPHGDWAWEHARADQRPPSAEEWLFSPEKNHVFSFRLICHVLHFNPDAVLVQVKRMKSSGLRIKYNKEK